MNNTTNSFVLFGRAFKNARKDFWVSIQVLFWITIALTILFYFVEHTAQPEEYKNPWNAFVWAITRYIGDPGHFAGNGPITLTGRYIDTAIGILKILIFAVPAGLVANGFKKAMDDEKRRSHLEECRSKILKSFRRQQTKRDHYRVIPRRVSVITLQAKKGMTENDVIDTVWEFDEFRLRNLATSQVVSEHPQDRLVIEMLPIGGSNEKYRSVDGFPIERTIYGIKINRGSNVTIIAPTAATENSIGNFSYYVAQFGGFNYVSREFVTDVDDPVSYYTINESEDKCEEALREFIKDVESISKNREKWNIILVASDNVHDTQFHFIHRANEKSGLTTTVLDENKFMQLYNNITSILQNDYNYATDLNEKYRPVGKKNIGVMTGGGKENNAFTVRISYSVVTWADNWSTIAIDMAKSIKQHLESPKSRAFEELPAWKKKGCGFGECEEDSFNK